MIYLASKSPQRQELLNQAGIPFQLVVSECDEESIILPHPQACAVERAVAKACSVPLDTVPKEPAGAILAADTVVSLNGDMIGKPKDRDHARATLQALQSTSHIVSTAHCMLLPDSVHSSQVKSIAVTVAKVTMGSMSAEDIEAYLDGGEWENRAGAYAIQETGDRFVTDLEGEFDTVVGLNLATVRHLYYEIRGEHLPGGAS